MRRFRLSTLMLLVVIAALSLALVVQHGRAARREDDLRRIQRVYAQLLSQQPRKDPWESFLKQYREREELTKRELEKPAEAQRQPK